MVKNSPVYAGDIRDAGLISGSDYLQEGMITHASILAWRIQWTEEPRRLQSIGLQSRTQLKRLSLCTHTSDNS